MDLSEFRKLLKQEDEDGDEEEKAPVTCEFSLLGAPGLVGGKFTSQSGARPQGSIRAHLAPLSCFTG